MTKKQEVASKMKKPWIRHGVSSRFEFHRGSLGNKKGEAYSVYYSDRTKGKTTERGYPNYISALFKTKKEAREDAEKFKKGGASATEWYGSAEK
jgi:hypothetical protein